MQLMQHRNKLTYILNHTTVFRTRGDTTATALDNYRHVADAFQHLWEITDAAKDHMEKRNAVCWLHWDFSFAVQYGVFSLQQEAQHQVRQWCRRHGLTFATKSINVMLAETLQNTSQQHAYPVGTAFLQHFKEPHGEHTVCAPLDKDKKRRVACSAAACQYRLATTSMAYPLF